MRSYTLRKQPASQTSRCRTFLPPPKEDSDLELELEVREGDSALQRSLEELVGGAPEHFPQGTADILERTGGALTYGPIVQNEEPSDAELETLRATVLEAPTLQRAFFSTARDVAIVRVELERGLEIREQTDAMSGLEEAVHQIPAPDGFQVRLAGLPHLKVSVGTELGKDHIQLIVLAIFANLLVLAIGFRSVPSALLPLAAAGISLCSVLGAMGWLGIPLDLLTTIVPPLLITVVVSDAIHFIARYREELREHPPFFAGQITLRRIGAACFVTSLTTAIGFASLALADTIALRRFGLVAAFAVFSGYGITMALLAAALPSRERRQQGPPVAQRLRLILSRIASQSVNRPWLTISLSAALLASALSIGVNVRTDSVMLDQFHSEHPLRQSAEILDQKLGGIRQMEVLVSSTNESILAPASSENPPTQHLAPDSAKYSHGPNPPRSSRRNLATPLRRPRRERMANSVEAREPNAVDERKLSLLAGAPLVQSRASDCTHRNRAR